MKILIADSGRGAFLWKNGEILRLDCPAECPYCPAADRERLYALLHAGRVRRERITEEERRSREECTHE